MTGDIHPTNPQWELFDPEVYPPPKGVSLLLINEGGVLIVGQWYEGAAAWGRKPTIPESVKARGYRKVGALDPKFQGILKSLLEYSAETGVFNWRLRRGRASAGSVAGSIDSWGYRQIKINGRAYLAHRLAWVYVHGRWPADQLDHKNLDKLDNRVGNLRETSNKANSERRGVRSNNQSGVIGVSWNNFHGKWKAQIAHDGKVRHIGYFTDIGEAAKAREEAVAETFCTWIDE